MSRQSKRNESSNIYGEHFNDRAEDIADRSLNNEFLSPNDSVGIAPEKFGIGEFVDVKLNSGKTGAAREGKSTHSEPTPAHDRAAHETHSLKDESPTHADESVRKHK